MSTTTVFFIYSIRIDFLLQN